MSKKKIQKVAQAIQKLLGNVARNAAYTTGFIKRMRKITPEAFVQGLVFAWLQNPSASLEQLAQSVSILGSPITPQALHARFTESAALFLEQVLQFAALETSVSNSTKLQFLQRFNGVFIHDSSTVLLAPVLAKYYQGCGGSKGENSAVKLHLRLELSSGLLKGPILTDGKAHDRSCSLYKEELPPGSLSINDLGFFCISVFKKHIEQGRFFLSRYMVNTNIFTNKKQKSSIDLSSFLRKKKSNTVDIPVYLGAKERLPVRLLAIKVPPNIANKRRRELKAKAERKTQPVSKKRLQLCDWFIMITNVPPEKLNSKEAVILYRSRWQIELVFRLWKKDAIIDKSKSKNPMRQLCELYAKLIGVLLQHWIQVVSLWHYPNHSMEKAFTTIQMFVSSIVMALNSYKELTIILTKIAKSLESGCRIYKSRKKPRTWQLLLEVEQPNSKKKINVWA